MLWPKVETARPYDLSKVRPQARPLPGQNPEPPTDFPIGEAQHPRRCAGPTDRLPDGVVYWCLSCNRRVRNYNQPFCATEHQAERRRYVRAFRREEARDVKVKRADLKALHAKMRDLVNRKNAVIAARTPDRRREAVGALLNSVDDLEKFMEDVIPTDKVEVPPPKP